MKTNQKGLIAPILALFLLLAISFLAFYLSGSKQPSAASAMQGILADYQAESAITQVLLKAQNNPKLPEQNISKEILPGVFFNLSASRQSPNSSYIWLFNGEITGNYFVKKIKVTADFRQPHKIIYQP